MSYSKGATAQSTVGHPCAAGDEGLHQHHLELALGFSSTFCLFVCFWFCLFGFFLHTLSPFFTY